MTCPRQLASLKQISIAKLLRNSGDALSSLISDTNEATSAL